jgi:hypothetical protein
VKYWLRQLKSRRTNLQNEHTGVRAPVDDIDARNLAVLARRLSCSVRPIAEGLRHRFSTIHIHMVRRLQLMNQHLHCVPDQLSGESRKNESANPGISCQV